MSGMLTIVIGLGFWAVFIIGFLVGAFWAGRRRDEMDQADCRGQ